MRGDNVKQRRFGRASPESHTDQESELISIPVIFPTLFTLFNHSLRPPCVTFTEGRSSAGTGASRLPGRLATDATCRQRRELSLGGQAWTARVPRRWWAWWLSVVVKGRPDVGCHGMDPLLVGCHDRLDVSPLAHVALGKTV